MSKMGGMGSKRIGSKTNKGMGKCSGKKAHQCGNGPSISYIQTHEERRKHGQPDVPHPDQMNKAGAKDIKINLDQDKL